LKQFSESQAAFGTTFESLAVSGKPKIVRTITAHSKSTVLIFRTLEKKSIQ